jgi:hypothetical protein
MQYGLTVRPVELVEEIEAPLKTPPADTPQEGPPRPGAPALDQAATPSEDGERKRRRRGRRGGRNRRRDGGDTVA